MKNTNVGVGAVGTGMIETNMSFEQALFQIKNGQPLSRTGWNGKGLWVTAQFPDVGSKNTKPYLVMNSGGNDRLPWTPSQLDFFANDWFVVKGWGTGTSSL